MTRRGPSVSFPQGSPVPAWFANGPGKPVSVRFAGFSYGTGWIGASMANVTGLTAFRRLTIPLWFMLVITFALPAGRWIGLLRRWREIRRRAAAGLCLRCGYDLRATPGKCPECGAGSRAALGVMVEQAAFPHDQGQVDNGHGEDDDVAEAAGPGGVGNEEGKESE